MLSPAPPAGPAQGLGATAAARLGALLLSGPGETLKAADTLLPSLGRAFSPEASSPDATAWFARAAANELAALPLDRAALGLVLLRPALAAGGGLEAAARGISDAYGADAAAGALESVYFARYGGAAFTPSAAPPGAAELLALLRSSGAAVVPAAKEEVAAEEEEEGDGGHASAAALGVTIGVASLAVAARLAGRALGVGQPAARMLFGSWWVLGATVSAAALLSEWMLSSGEEGGEEESEEGGKGDGDDLL
ncbi:MAG: hypothetical protein J3K34DRAFT_423110 [Monoraphidium minutum]|nr:MAG: hypothetical protein J3K34DRAFT_423110 [Monoraphidium minutum]